MRWWGRGRWRKRGLRVVRGGGFRDYEHGVKGLVVVAFGHEGWASFVGGRVQGLLSVIKTRQEEIG